MQRNIARISALAFIFLIWPILVARAEILAIFRCIFGKFKTPQFCSEIIWPLHMYVLYFDLLFEVKQLGLNWTTRAVHTEIWPQFTFYGVICSMCEVTSKYYSSGHLLSFCRTTVRTYSSWQKFQPSSQFSTNHMTALKSSCRSPGLWTTLLVRDSAEEIHGFGEYCKYGHIRQVIAKANPWNKQTNIKLQFGWKMSLMSKKLEFSSQGCTIVRRNESKCPRLRCLASLDTSPIIGQRRSGAEYSPSQTEK